MTPHITSNRLAVPHGFFGSQGGVSTGIYESLNTGLRSGDDKTHVAENRARIRKALGAEYLVSLHQVHSDRVIIATNEPVSEIEADGLVTTVPGLAISALSADCGPVLLADTKAGVIGACHAGWRGALSGIVESTPSSGPVLVQKITKSERTSKLNFATSIRIMRSFSTSPKARKRISTCQPSSCRV